MFNIIKKIIKWFFIILGLLLCLLIGFFFLTSDTDKLPKEEIPILKETKMAIHKEWYDNDKKCQMIKAKYTFNGL